MWILTRLHDLWRRGRDPATDAELLGRFTRHGDDDAFAELVDRLGPLVYGVCRRMLVSPADAEDAFQAAFLVLVRRADALAGRAVGPWLHRVAVLTARRFRRTARPAVTPPDGQTPPALRKRLAGADAPLTVAGAAVVPPGLARAAAQAAAVFRTSTPAAGVSPAVAELTEGVLHMFRAKQWATGLAAAAVVATGIGFGSAGWFSPRAEAQPAPQPDGANARREKLEAEIAAAKARLKQLEDDQRELLKLSTQQLAGKKAAVESHIGLWVQSPARPAGVLGLRGDLNRDAAAESLGLIYRHGPATIPGGGWRSEFAVNEFTEGRPVIEAHFFSLGSLKTYLARAAKDPAAPKKLRLHVDREYPWAKLKPVLDACKEAGFVAIELTVAEGGQVAPGKAARGREPGILPGAAEAAPDVEAADSKRRYIVIRGPQGEQVHSLPATGTETVIDAIGRVDGLLGWAAAAQVWIARRARLDGQPPQILPVDVAGITRQGQTATNHQLLSGDRVCVTPRE